jgi:serine/threonine protein kinase
MCIQCWGSTVLQPYLFGDYLIVDRIGVGGMAEVFKARHRNSEPSEWVVLKRLLPHLTSDRRMIQMFAHEAEIASRLEHKNLVRVMDTGQVDNDWFLTQAYVPGLDFQSVLKYITRSKTRIPIDSLLYLFVSMADGLEHCHRLTDGDGGPLGLVHRDVTPENMLLSFEGDVKLTDFGIASSLLLESTTQHGAPKGKTRYMSPEQALLKPLDARSDVFSLGAVLYEATTLKTLFDGPNQFVILDKIRSGIAIPTQLDTAGYLPPALEGVILKNLQYDREARTPSAAAFREALAVFQAPGTPATRSDAFGRWLRTHFVSAVTGLEDRQEHHLRLEVLSDGQIIEHAPPTEDVTSQWQVPLSNLEDPPTATMAVLPPPEVSIIGGLLDEPPPPHASESITLSVVPQAPRAPQRILPPLDNTGTPTPATTADISHPFTLASEVSNIDTTAKLLQVEWRRIILIVCAAVLGCLAGTFIPTSFFKTSAGSLFLLTEPSLGLTVTLDGQNVAERTPLVIQNLLEGQHALKVVADGYEDEALTITLVPGQAATLRRRLRPKVAPLGRLRIHVMPKTASVIINGDEHPKDDVFLGPMDAPLKVLVSHAGYTPLTRTLQLKGNAIRTLRIELAPVLGDVLVDSRPNGTVLLNGIRRGRTPVTIRGLDVNEEWTRQIVAKGHALHTETFRFKDKRIFMVDKDLKPQE